MKDLMKHLFHKPKVLFMLMVICLGPPPRTIQTIQACPPVCSAEEAAVADAEDAVADAEKTLDTANKNLEKALKKVAAAKKAHKDALDEVARASQILAGAVAAALSAGLVLKAALKTKNPWAIAAAILALAAAWIFLHVAEDDWNKANEALIETGAALHAAKADVADCEAAVDDAQTELDAAEDELEDAEAALEACEADE